MTAADKLGVNRLHAADWELTGCTQILQRSLRRRYVCLSDYSLGETTVERRRLRLYRHLVVELKCKAALERGKRLKGSEQSAE